MVTGVSRDGPVHARDDVERQQETKGSQCQEPFPQRHHRIPDFSTTTA